ncbi:hypothetical protein OCK74_13475 [Chitinophagaceae bacterium LB-8]|uniref:Uncharacterized protein n=1 Tax=Paraflavisolibacter caeni TaxID=2982496 RepID=A0A9X2XYV4_9BACT|nr:hypothetical protein [Paraflavisolibacter caeni]MCU7550128.1 hypothetical protein [Paraflavisolibacter caeni]
MRAFIYTILTCIFILSAILTEAQKPKPADFYFNIKNFDLSKLWKSDSITIEGDGDKIPFPEPLGFIGEEFHRFYIHYTSVTKSKDTPYLYYITGKTRVKNNICNFTGEILVQKAVTYKEPVIPEYKQYKSGSVTCLVTFYEDSTQSSSGIIKGKLTSDFYLDKKGRLHYDALMFGSDGFSNNGSEATWTSYKTGKSKKCNWGDFRIPGSEKLDIGVGEFSVAGEYVRNGWETYRKAWSGDPDAPETTKAKEAELRKWWQ